MMSAISFKPMAILKIPTDAFDIVRKMACNDIVDVLMDDLGLSPNDASHAAGLLKQHSMQEDATDSTVGVLSIEFPDWQFPAEPQEFGANDWPYDDFTVNGMKQSDTKRGLTN